MHTYYNIYLIYYQQRNGQENSPVTQRSRRENIKTHPGSLTVGNQGQQNQKEEIVPPTGQPAQSDQWARGISCWPWNKTGQNERRKGKKDPEEVREEEKGYSWKEKIK